jgi:hypothetical protein
MAHNFILKNSVVEGFKKIIQITKPFSPLFESLPAGRQVYSLK